MEKCVENLNAAIKQTTSSKAIESIELQISYHEKQLSLMNMKMALYEKSEKVKNEIDDFSLKFSIDEKIENATVLQLDLLRNLTMVEKELEELKKSNPDSNLTEIHQLNSQFNILLCKLFNHVDQTTRENIQLRDGGKLQEELPALCIDNQQTIHQQQSSSNNENKVQELTSSSSIPSPSNQEEADEDEEEENCDLPPLEFPVFEIDK